MSYSVAGFIKNYPLFDAVYVNCTGQEKTYLIGLVKSFAIEISDLEVVLVEAAAIGNLSVNSVIRAVYDLALAHIGIDCNSHHWCEVVQIFVNGTMSQLIFNGTHVFSKTILDKVSALGNVKMTAGERKVFNNSQYSSLTWS